VKRAFADHGMTVDTSATWESYAQGLSQVALVDLLLIFLPFGPLFGLTRLAWCNADATVTWDGVAYGALGVTRFSRSEIQTSVGVEVDTLKVTLEPYVLRPNPVTPGDSEFTLDVIPGTTLTIPAAAALGLFDKAIVQLRRLLLPAPPQWHQPIDASAGAVLLFVGDVGEIEVNRAQVKLTVRSRLDQLAVNLPRSQYQPGCLNQLFDTICGLSRTGSYGGTSFNSAHTVDGPNTTTMSVALQFTEPRPDGYFDQGYIEVAAGPFIGLRRTIRSHRGKTIKLTKPFPFALEDGAQVMLYAGCDKTQATCAAKFGNTAAFRGFPFIPNPDTAF
jgi:hypothetical protein